LINNAGATLVRRFVDVDLDEAERMLRLDLVNPLRLTRAVLPGMIARGRGTIVDVCSIAAFAALLGTTYYGAAKAGLAAASEILRGGLRGRGGPARQRGARGHGVSGSDPHGDVHPGVRLLRGSLDEAARGRGGTGKARG